jgi:hypothetical protein
MPTDCAAELTLEKLVVIGCQSGRSSDKEEDRPEQKNGPSCPPSSGQTTCCATEGCSF